MHTFSAVGAYRFAWETFKKRPWFLVGASFVIIVLGWLIGAAAGILGAILGTGLGDIVRFVASFAGQMLLGMGTIALYLKVHDHTQAARLQDLWHPRPFWRYAGVSILAGIILMLVVAALVALAVVLFISAGPLVGTLVTLALAVLALIPVVIFLFPPYFVVDKGEGVWEAVRGGVRIAREHFWQLVLLILISIGINILGMLALLVGVLVSSALTGIAFVHTYRTLSR